MDALVGEDQDHHQHDQVVQHAEPAFDGRRDPVIEDIDDDVLIFQHIDPHAPEGGEGEQGHIELGKLLPAQGEEITGDHGEDHQHGQQPHGGHADPEIDREDLLAYLF